MAASFVIPDRIIQDAMTRALRIDNVWRYIIAGGRAHGTSPDRHVKTAMKSLGLNLVLRGKGKYIDDTGREYDLYPGIVFHRFPNKIHTTWFDPDSDYTEFFVCLDAATAAQMQQLGLVSQSPLLDVGVSQVIIDEYIHLLDRMRMTETELSTPAMLMDVLNFVNGLYDRARRKRALGYWEKIIADARLLLERDLGSRVSMEAIADKLGVSYTAFRKKFRESVGVSPGDYRIHCRLESARNLLLNRSIKQVATTLGYCDQFTFSNQFKSYVGVSPRAYQQRQKVTGNTY